MASTCSSSPIYNKKKELQMQRNNKKMSLFSVDANPPGLGIGIQESKNDPQKKLRNFMFWSATCSLWGAERFSTCLKSPSWRSTNKLFNFFKNYFFHQKMFWICYQKMDLANTGPGSKFTKKSGSESKTLGTRSQLISFSHFKDILIKTSGK